MGVPKLHRMKRKLNISVSKSHDDGSDDIPDTPEGRLDLVEQLRLQAGKFLYEYPTEFRRVIEVVRRK
jgi:hypothetical protein